MKKKYIFGLTIILTIAILILIAFVYNHERNNRIKEIALKTLSSIQDASKTKKYGQAYELMSPKFKEDFPSNKFPKECDLISKVFKDTKDIKSEFAYGRFYLFKEKKYNALSLGFEKVENKWLCVGIEIQKEDTKQ